MLKEIQFMAPITIYHNPACGTSRNVLAFIRNTGVEPEVIEYLINPPSRQRLLALIAQMGISVRALLRSKDSPYKELALGNLALSDDALVDAMLAHPILFSNGCMV